jgi:hypothetical protein
MDNQMTPEEAKASLGLATHLQSFLLPKGQGQASQTSDSAPGEAQPPEQPTTDMKAEIQALESRIMQEIGGLKQEIQKAQPKDANQEIDDLKKQIEAVLNE